LKQYRFDSFSKVVEEKERIIGAVIQDAIAHAIDAQLGSAHEFGG
jgi:hypothetical protein